MIENSNSIPKVIHYCWFGGKSLSKKAIKCIDSWKEYFPEYEIKEWNETNYDVHKIPYIDQAYNAKKYAFVSDYARFDILYQYGGIYFDTDVEVLKSFEDIIIEGPFMGCEIDGNINSSIMVAAGLGLASYPGHRIYKEIIDIYNSQTFIEQDGSYNLETVVTRITNILKKHGLKNNNRIQKIEGITIYPKEYFNPYNDLLRKLDIKNNTHSIHWYSATWQSPTSKYIKILTFPIRRIFGEDIFIRIKELIRLK